MSFYIINEQIPEEKSFRLCQGSNLDRPVVQFVVRHCADWATRLPYLTIRFHNSLVETEENNWRPLSTQPEFQSGLEQARSHIVSYANNLGCGYEWQIKPRNWNRWVWYARIYFFFMLYQLQLRLLYLLITPHFMPARQVNMNVIINYWERSCCLI
jgi:hypothetical protein